MSLSAPTAWVHGTLAPWSFEERQLGHAAYTYDGKISAIYIVPWKTGPQSCKPAKPSTVGYCYDMRMSELQSSPTLDHHLLYTVQHDKAG
jgi:hypothetical protein